MVNKDTIVVTADKIIVSGLDPFGTGVLVLTRDPKVEALHELVVEIANRGGRITGGDRTRVARVLRVD